MPISGPPRFFSAKNAVNGVCSLKVKPSMSPFRKQFYLAFMQYKSHSFREAPCSFGICQTSPAAYEINILHRANKIALSCPAFCSDQVNFSQPENHKVFSGSEGT